MKNLLYLAALIFLLSACSERRPHRTQLTREAISLGRDEWRVAMRGGEISPEKILQAREEVRGLVERERRKRDAGIQDWEFVGPPDVGGRVRALAVHPNNSNVLYTGGVAGGIFKSTNGGASWTALDDFLPSLSVTSIIINPNNPSIVYAATGEGITARENTGDPGAGFNSSSVGAGIFKSTDAGDTWDLVGALDPNDLSGFYWVNDLAFDPVNPNIFYAATTIIDKDHNSFSAGGLYRFTQGGDVVEQIPILSGVSSPGNAYCVYVNPNDRSNIFIGYSAGLYVSQDTGNTWTSSALMPGFPFFCGRVEVGMSASDEDIVYALCGGTSDNSGLIMRSLDKGIEWDTMSSGLNIFTNSRGNAGSYHNSIWVDPEDADNLIVGGIDLWRSTNSGATLTQISDNDQHGAGLSAHADHHIIVAAQNFNTITNPKIYTGNDGGVASNSNYKTATTTTGWTLNSTGLNITQFYDSDIDGNNPTEIIAGSQDNGTWESDDSGDTWTKVGFGDGGFCALNKSGLDPRYLSSQYGVIETTAPPLNGYYPYFFLEDHDNAPFIAELEIYPNAAEYTLVGGDELWHLTHTPAGAVHKNVSPRSAIFDEYVTAIEISEDSSVVLVGYKNGDLYINENGTAGSWTSLNLPETGVITDIALHPTNYDKIFVTLGAYRDDNIWFTNDGGTTWEERSAGIPALHVNTVVWHPDNGSWAYVGSDMGVFATENNGNAWSVQPAHGSSEGPVNTEVTHLQFTMNNTFGEHWLVATTFGRGIWKTKYVVRKDVYVDEDCTQCGIGIESIPLQTIEEAEERQAHGQRWTIDAGTYPISNKVVIDKNINEIQVDGKVTIGN